VSHGEECGKPGRKDGSTWGMRVLPLLLIGLPIPRLILLYFAFR